MNLSRKLWLLLVALCFLVKLSVGTAYCASKASYDGRTDFATVQLPATPNVSAGMNAVVTDPDFGTTIVRASDGNSIPQFANASFNAGDAGGINVWNLDSTRFIFFSDGGGVFVASFDPTKLVVTPDQSWLGVGSPAWSRVNPDILYLMSRSTILSFDFSTGDNPTGVLVFDFSNCLPIAVVRWNSLFGVSVDDQTFAVGLSDGQQGTGVYAAAYTLSLGCRVLNTMTGQVTGQWGPIGTITNSDRFSLHEVTLSKLGDYVILGKAQALPGNPYFWQLNSLNVSVLIGGAEATGGHAAQGYTTWLNAAGQFGNVAARPYANLPNWHKVAAQVPPGLIPPLDSHLSWHNDNPADTAVIGLITTSTLTPFPAAWYNELLLFDPLLGVVYREGHTFDTGHSVYFSTSQAMGAISQDGRFILFGSDWMNTLGRDHAGNPRGDIFIAVLH